MLYPYPETDDVKRAVNDALRTFYLNDLYLIEHDVHECSMTFRLGFYLQQIFPDWDVDCEFNRDVNSEDGIKRIPVRSHGRQKLKDIVPDIIIHKRGTEHNLLLIEAKKAASAIKKKKDIAKIETSLLENTLHYRYGLFLDIQSTREETADASVFFSQTGKSSLRLKIIPSTPNEVK